VCIAHRVTPFTIADMWVEFILVARNKKKTLPAQTFFFLRPGGGGGGPI